MSKTIFTKTRKKKRDEKAKLYQHHFAKYEWMNKKFYERDRVRFLHHYKKLRFNMNHQF